MDGVKTLEDFATCADWELAGGWTTENGQRIKDEGVLEKFDVSLEEAQTPGDDRARHAGLGRSDRSWKKHDADEAPKTRRQEA